MNNILKYIIFFLLGVIIYYFLFNNTNNEAKKLIEGFSQTIIDNSEIIYLKSRYQTGTPSAIGNRYEGIDADTMNANVTPSGLDAAAIYLSEIPAPDLVGVTSANSPASSDILSDFDFSEDLLTNDPKESKFINTSIFSQNLDGNIKNILGIENLTGSNVANINYKDLGPEVLTYIGITPGILQNVPFKIEIPSGSIKLKYSYEAENSDDITSAVTLSSSDNFDPIDDSGLTNMQRIFTPSVKSALGISNNSTISTDNSLIYTKTATSVTHYFIIYNPDETPTLFSPNMKILFATNDTLINEDFNNNHNFEESNARPGVSQNAIEDAGYKIFKYDLSGLEELSNENGAGVNGNVNLEILRNIIVAEDVRKSLKITVNIPYTDDFRSSIRFKYDEGKIVKDSDSTGIHYLNYVSKNRSLQLGAALESVGERQEIETSLILLADIMGTDDSGSFGGGAIGCDQTVCQRANIRLQDDPHNRVRYTMKEEGNQGQNFHDCSPAEKGTPEFEATTRPSCSPSLCCYDSSCLSQFFAQGLDCGESQILGSAYCEGTGGEDCRNQCCGDPISGPLRKMFYSIKSFGQTITARSTQPNAGKIFLKDIVYYIYYHMLDLHAMLDSSNGGGITDPDSSSSTNIPQMFTATGVIDVNNHTEDNYEKLRRYFESAFQGTIQGSGQFNTSDTYQDVMGKMKIKGEDPPSSGGDEESGTPRVSENDETVSAFIIRLSRLRNFHGGGGKTLQTITTNFENYLKYYDSYQPPADDAGAGSSDHNDHAALIADLKHAIARMTIDSPNLKDGQGTSISKPISLFSLGATNFLTKQISLSEFQLFL